MKRVIGIIIIVLVLAVGIGYKVLSSRGVIGNESQNGGDSSTGNVSQNEPASGTGTGGALKNLFSKRSGLGGASGKEPKSADSVKCYNFVTPEPMTVPASGGYVLSTVDFGEGAVPLLTIPLDTWGGYAALFAANANSAAENPDSLFYKNGRFAVELVYEEAAEAQTSGYAAGKYPLIWAPMDSLPVLYDTFRTNKALVPRVLGLFDWSSGGDGILVKDYIKTPTDLKNKIVLTSSNTPYSFFLLWYLAQYGMNGNDVKVIWEGDGVAAQKMFKEDENIAAWVSWTPFTTEVTDKNSDAFIENTRLLISSKDANRLIADTYIVRNDFFRENTELLTAFVTSMMEATELITDETYQAMADFYKMDSATEARRMMNDVHIANFPENKMFFDDTNQIGAYKIFYLSQEYNKQLGTISADANYDPASVLGAKVLADIEQKGLFANQTNTAQNSFNKTSALDIVDLENRRLVLTNSINLFFEAQKLDFDIDSSSAVIQENMRMLESVAEQTSFLATTIVKLIGYLDTAKVEEFKAQGNQAYIEAAAQAKLVSKKRAEFVKQVLVSRYGIEAERIITEGRGWDSPIDTDDPTKNRRVEVKFLSLE